MKLSRRTPTESKSPTVTDNTPRVIKQASEGRGGPPLAREIRDRVPPDRVSWRIPRLDGGRSQREVPGLEFLADDSEGLAPARS